MEITRIEKFSESQDFGRETPKFELDYFGKDLMDHNGIKWIYLICPHCGTRVKFSPIHVVVVKGEELGMLTRDYHYLCKCEYCNDVVYAKFWEVDFDPDWHFAYEMHFPAAIFNGSVDLPEQVNVSFSEATKCLNADASLATLVMCRRTVEAIVRDKGGSSGGGLYSEIDKLIKDGTLPDSMGRLANVIRMVGNKGAHASELATDSKQARDAYELTKKMIDVIYLVPRQVHEIRSKLEQEKSVKTE
ncbi:DUF4145 domain-containing protein [Azospirillum brasilense]|uniref:DUF4145 domain-containing protein n=1 Tax=Azospirillum brasilense TaxID=192 RepID=UPI000E68032F|nr:DUF4145 domain-containing protein [Azospirillum brasilense]NUB27225.1 DUF4145 domain-containing protein [Azospirillum brasilense]NUB36316.1 DUF4145 domain-containing protein [Azospirillum brasilense]RIW07765.1 DUF4145 domain-containing protein [Azospirillum brasilense]